jgi:ABC-type sugar transport system ATPase subunit
VNKWVGNEENLWLKESIIYVFRSRCAAVIMGDTIVVMGGGDLTQDTSFLDDQYYRNTVNHTTAEYLVLGENKWKELPPMHHERVGATACLLP